MNVTLVGPPGRSVTLQTISLGSRGTSNQCSPWRSYRDVGNHAPRRGANASGWKGCRGSRDQLPFTEAALSTKPFICFSDRSIYAYTFNGWRLPNGTLPIRHCPKKGRLMDKLYYGNCRAGRAAGPADFT